MNKLNLDYLHKVPELLKKHGSGIRQIGKTMYCLQTIMGYLNVLENETIIVIIHSHKDLPNYFNPLDELFREDDLEPIYHINERRISFKNNSNRIKFMTVNTLAEHHPTSFSSSHDVYLIIDLDNMPPHFFNDGITIGDSHLLSDYRQYIKSSR